MQRLTLDIAYLCTEFDNSNFSRTGVTPKFKIGHVTTTTPPSWTVCSP